jgi:hypothetical protein
MAMARPDRHTAPLDGPRAPLYDADTLRRARDGSPLHAQQGIAATCQWAARVAPDLCLDLPGAAPGATATYVAHPGHRAAARATLDAFQAYVDHHPDVLTHPLRVDHRASTPDTVCLAVPPAGVGVGISRAHAALVGDADVLLALRRSRGTYVVVVRAGRVVAAIRVTRRHPAVPTLVPHVGPAYSPGRRD